jgi:hypothetical protein
MQGTQGLGLLFLDSHAVYGPGQTLVDRMGTEVGLGWPSIDPVDRKPGTHV